MSKLFKYLGIGTAIGTLAYAVIKYKHDEKFKEKVDDVVDKAEEVADKTVGKVFDFMSEHPTLTVMGVVGAAMIPAWIITAKGAKERQEHWIQACDAYTASLSQNDDKESDWINEIAKTEAQKQIELENIKAEQTKKTISIFDNWKEDYRDSFDEVTELSKRITLHPGESYMIEEPRQFGLDTDRPIVSHLINGTGCYPPEVKDDQFID